MSWHDDLASEIAGVFSDFTGEDPWSAILSMRHRRMLASAAWHGKPENRRRHLATCARNYAASKTKMVGAFTCKGCGKRVAKTLERARHRTTTLCSRTCVGNYNAVRAPLYTIGKQSRTLRGWCSLYGINRDTVCSRMRRGMSLESALTTRRAAKGEQQ